MSRDLPIPFSAPMVLALLREIEAPGTGKTCTRRILKTDVPDGSRVGRCHHCKSGWALWRPDGGCTCQAVPVLYAVGDRLWCRETYYQSGHWEQVTGHMTRSGKRQKWRFVAADDVVLFTEPAEFRKGRHAADPGAVAWHRRLPRFMPRRYSRITLTVTEVRVERLQDISEEDARAEGVGPLGHPLGRTDLLWVGSGMTWQAPVLAFKDLWNSLHGPNAWQTNPWVCAIRFVPALRNIDAKEAK